MRRAALLLCLAAVPSRAGVPPLSEDYGRASGAVRREVERRAALRAALPSKLTLRLAVHGVVGPGAVAAPNTGFERRVSEIQSLNRNRDWLERLQKKPAHLVVELSDLQPGALRYRARISAAGRRFDGFGAVTAFAEPDGLLELRVMWTAPGGAAEAKAYFQPDGRGGVVLVRFREPGFLAPEAADSLAISSDYRIDGGYEILDYPVDLASAKVLSLESEPSRP